MHYFYLKLSRKCKYIHKNVRVQNLKWYQKRVYKVLNDTISLLIFQISGLVMRFSRLYKEKRLDTLISLYQTYSLNMVPEDGLEPSRYHYRWILSPLRLPIPPLGQQQ